MAIFDERIKRQSDFDETVKLKLERAEFVQDKHAAIQDALEYAEQERCCEKSFSTHFLLSFFFSSDTGNIQIRQKIFYVSNNLEASTFGSIRSEFRQPTAFSHLPNTT